MTRRFTEVRKTYRTVTRNGVTIDVSPQVIQSVSGYKSDVRSGDFHTPLAYSWGYSSIYGDPSGKSHFGNITGDALYGFPVDALDGRTFDSLLYNRALSKFNERIRGSIDLAVEVATAAQTAHMFNTWDRAVSVARAFRSPLTLAKGVAGAYLEFTYGVQPELQTAYEAVDKFFQLTDSLITKIRVTEYGVEDLSSKIRWENIGNNAPYCPISTHRKTMKMCRFHANVDLSRVARGPQWTSYNPFSIAWELVPYSFVVDWFLDIGSFLRNYETTLLLSGLPLSRYYVSQFFWEASRALPGFYGPAPDGGFIEIARGIDYQVKLYDRSTPDSYPTPKFPKFDINLSSRRLLNAAALLTQFL